MRNRRIYMTDHDMERLNELLYVLKGADSRDNGSVEPLKKEMERAKIVSAANISGDIVTMNSRVRLKDMMTDEDMVFQIVYPANADLEKGKISVLSPIGTALLGYRVGDIISWKVPRGVRQLKIEGMLYQPEAAGDFFQ